MLSPWPNPKSDPDYENERAQEEVPAKRKRDGLLPIIVVVALGILVVIYYAAKALMAA